MLDLGWTELLLIGLVALIVVGPKELPGMFRAVGRYVGKMRGMAREFQSAMEAAAEESGVNQVSRDLRDVASGKDMGLEAFRDVAKGPKGWVKDAALGKGKSGVTDAGAAAGQAGTTAGSAPQQGVPDAAGPAPAPHASERPGRGPAVEALARKRAADAEARRAALAARAAGDTGPARATSAAATEPAVRPAPQPRPRKIAKGTAPKPGPQRPARPRRRS